jgi:hypothetical protein
VGCANFSFPFLRSLVPCKGFVPKGPTKGPCRQYCARRGRAPRPHHWRSIMHWVRRSSHRGRSWLS